MNQSINSFSKFIYPSLAVVFALAGILDAFQPALFSINQPPATNPELVLFLFAISLVFGAIGARKSTKLGRIVAWISIGVVVALILYGLGMLFMVGWAFRDYKPGLPNPVSSYHQYNPAEGAAGYVSGPVTH